MTESLTVFLLFFSRFRKRQRVFGIIIIIGAERYFLYFFSLKICSCQKKVLTLQRKVCDSTNHSFTNSLNINQYHAKVFSLISLSVLGGK